MELEKVINPALQQGQDSSIKPVHKDFPFSITASKALRKVRKRLVVCQKERLRGPQISAALII